MDSRSRQDTWARQLHPPKHAASMAVCPTTWLAMHRILPNRHGLMCARDDGSWAPSRNEAQEPHRASSLRASGWQGDAVRSLVFPTAYRSSMTLDVLLTMYYGVVLGNSSASRIGQGCG